MESFAKMYYQLYGISLLDCVFYSVWRGRPDMAPYKFINAIHNNLLLTKYGKGTSSRDYTYIDDIVSGVIKALEVDTIQCEVYNLGNSSSVSLNTFIELCENTVGKKAIIQEISDQLGDVPHTCANIEKAKKDLNYNPKTTLDIGLKKCEWYLDSNLYENIFFLKKKYIF